MFFDRLLQKINALSTSVTKFFDKDDTGNAWDEAKPGLYRSREEDVFSSFK